MTITALIVTDRSTLDGIVQGPCVTRRAPVPHRVRLLGRERAGLAAPVAGGE